MGCVSNNTSCSLSLAFMYNQDMSMEAELEKANEEITRLRACLVTVEEEKTGLTRRCTMQGEVYFEEMNRMLAKVAHAEEELAQRERQLVSLDHERQKLIQEVGRLYMVQRDANEIFARFQHEIADLKKRLNKQPIELVRTETAATPSRGSDMRMVPHDIKGRTEAEVHAQLEAAASTIRATDDTPLPKRKPGL